MHPTKCSDCQSTHIRKSGRRRGKQNNICVAYRRHFVENLKAHRDYSDDIRALCLKIAVNGMGF